MNHQAIFLNRDNLQFLFINYLQGVLGLTGPIALEYGLGNIE